MNTKNKYSEVVSLLEICMLAYANLTAAFA